MELTDNKMHSAILAHLENIEHKYDVRVLLAIESGSRARGLFRTKAIGMCGLCMLTSSTGT